MARPTTTATAIAARIRADRGAAWSDDGLNGFVAGDPAITVRGVAVTAMPNIPLLKRAVAQGCNMVVSVESPLYAKPYDASANPASAGPAHAVTQLQADPTYRAKKAFIDENGLAIFRLNDALGGTDDRPLVRGISQAMGWRRHTHPSDGRLFTLPRQPLSLLAASVKRRLGLNGGMRVIGQPDHPVSKVLVVPGRVDPVAVVKLLPSVDVLLTGDLREWELVEYLTDSWETARPKALIAVGRIMSEQPGVLAAASWLRSIVDVPVTPLSVEDPYWRLPA